VAQVGSYVVTRAALAHAVDALVRRGGPAAVIPAFSSPGFQALVPKALDRLIVDYWAIGAGAEAGVSVSEGQVEQVLGREEAQEPPLSRFEKTLAETGRTIADLKMGIRVQLIEEAFRQKILSSTEHLTPAQVASYYEQHKSIFGTPQRRDLLIARMGTLAEALKVKREIASGKSFASVVKKIPLGQPIYSSNAFVSDYESEMYSEAPLNNAILAAKPKILTGPVKISLGYYVFEVKRIIPATQQTLAQSEAAIKATLPHSLDVEGTAAFIAAWRKKWTAKTSCQPAYVVPKCQQYTPPAGSTPEAQDPYTFN
jgi:hypothetical protein